MITSPIRPALVGPGRIGTRHARAIVREAPGAELAAVVDPRTDAVTAPAGELGVTLQVGFGALAVARAVIVSVQENRSVTIEEVLR
ncbi:Gfo/Idh/MocA family oxidoreductase [uncultured Propionibacterium sp.]|uniref:Gfo/Idh/MocA family oxidoreductase n=1 Tax=uncultured Propionibacterium sp. TaxID=218066 RepID=UPI00293090BD|nr:Gfo/Idh/MocA family oxidoreductase [uncultured Propionibacterium sp.]